MSSNKKVISISMIIVILLTQILAAFHSFNHKKEENSQLLNSEITKKQSFKNKKECNVCEVYFDFQPSDFLSTENISFVSNTSTSIKTNTFFKTVVYIFRNI